MAAALTPQSADAQPEQPLYVERAGSRRVLWGAVAVWFAFSTAPLLSYQGGVSAAISAGALVIYPVLAVAFSPFVVVPLVRDRFHTIRLDRSSLHVGREQLAIVAIDGDGVRELLADPDHVTVRAERRVERPLGGAWAVPFTMRAVRIPVRGGGGVIVATRRPVALLEAIARVA